MLQVSILKSVGITKAIWAYLEPLIASGFQAAVASAIPIVEPIVLGLAAHPTKSGAEKAADALKSSLPALEAAGINVGINVIKAAIEAAVSKLPKTPASTTQNSLPVATIPQSTAPTSLLP